MHRGLLSKAGFFKNRNTQNKDTIILQGIFQDLGVQLPLCLLLAAGDSARWNIRAHYIQL